jgi:hypothetical protein
VLAYRTLPPDDRILCEEHDGETRITIPPQRFGFAAFAGVLLFAPVFLVAGIALLAIGLVVSGLSLLAIGAGWLMETILLKRRRTEFIASDEALVVIVRGFVATEDFRWARTEISDVEAVHLGTSIVGRRVFELRVRCPDRRAQPLLTGHDESEIRWVAGLLQAVMRLPSPKSSD